jgi:hypothetical protein
VKVGHEMGCVSRGKSVLLAYELAFRGWMWNAAALECLGGDLEYHLYSSLYCRLEMAREKIEMEFYIVQLGIMQSYDFSF